MVDWYSNEDHHIHTHRHTEQVYACYYSKIDIQRHNSLDITTPRNYTKAVSFICMYLVTTPERSLLITLEVRATYVRKDRVK